MTISDQTNSNLGMSIITKGAFIIALFSIVSRLLGLIRDRLLSSTFGAGDILDAYYAAFRLPDFIFNILVLGGLASAFIPVIIESRSRAEDDESWKITNTIFNSLVLILVILAVVGIILAPNILPLVTPGFSQNKIDLTINLARVMLTAIVFFGASNVFSSILNSYKKFFGPGLAPVMYNLGIIFGIAVLVPLFGIIGLGWGVLLGSIVHMLVQLKAVVESGWRPAWVWDWTNRQVIKIVKLIMPRTLGLAVYSFNQFALTFFASTLAAGSLASFTLAINLQNFPINVFGISLATAAFPLLSEAWSQNNRGRLAEHFEYSFKRIMFFTIPLSIIFLILRAQIIRVILGTGAFDWDDTIRTADVFGLLAISLAAESLLPLVARTFYALQDTKTPVLVSIFSLVINILLAIPLTSYLGLSGLTISYVIAGVINFIVLISILGGRLHDIRVGNIVNSVARIILSSVLAGSLSYATLYLVAPHVDMHTFFGIFIQGLSAGLMGIVTYVVLAIFFKVEEVNFVVNWLKIMAIKIRLWI